jgi:hypothetical protein
MKTALAALADDDTVASVVCLAASRVLGDGWLLWEPESIWKELHHLGVDVPYGNRQQLMAGRSISTTGRVFYDALVFDRTATAFVNDVCDYEGFDDAVVAHYAWCVDEVAAISDQLGEHALHYDREPVSLVARRLRQDGFVLAPEQLSFVQPELDRVWGTEALELKQAVAKVWADAKGHQVRDIPYPETARGVQMARLASVAAFVEERHETRRKQRARLS